jgi:hypothetical protein
MKSFPLYSFLLAAFCLAVTGCRTHTETTSLGNGYEEVSHSIHTYIDEPPVPRISLQYHHPDSGKTTQVWPSLSAAKVVVRGNLAFFTGDTTRRETGSFASQPRLYAVQVPEPPVDITDEALWLWAKSAGKSFDAAASKLTLATPHDGKDGLSLHFEFTADNNFMGDNTWPDAADYELHWDQVTNLVHGVAAKATLRKDARWHIEYLKANF